MSSLLRSSASPAACLKAVTRQTFKRTLPLYPSLATIGQQHRRTFASTPQNPDGGGDSSSSAPPSKSSSSLPRNPPKKNGVASQTQPQPSRDQLQKGSQSATATTATSRPASGPDSQKAKEEGENAGGSAKREGEPEEDTFFAADNYIKPTLHVFSTFRKIIVYASAASVSIAVLVFLGFEGTHLYVENVSIRPTLADDDDDDEAAVWGWAVESQESWTGGKRGGTDPALGYRARHLIRAAWIAQNWGAGVGGPLQHLGPTPKSSDGGSVFNVTAYVSSAQFLGQAIALARQNPQLFPNDDAGGRMSDAALDLLLLHSRVLERIGTPGTITAARDDLLQIWEHGGLANHPRRQGRSIDAARVALKIGDLSNRLMEGDVAVGWWQKAIDYVTSAGSASDGSVGQSSVHVPTTLPPSPLAQRTLVSALVSLSTYYAATHQLTQADFIQRSALRLLSSSSLAQQTPSQQALITRDNAPAALHSLFLQHRASVLSIHHAQVLYATSAAASSLAPAKRSWLSSSKPAAAAPIDGVANAQIQLHSAASAAEKIAHTLTGASKPYSDAPSALTHNLSSVYTGDKVLARPAATLLRDARRTAAEAWNLSGMLYQLGGQKEDQSRALECFERAVHWSGGQTAAAGDPDSQVIQREWATYWKNYTSLKEKLANKVH